MEALAALEAYVAGEVDKALAEMRAAFEALADEAQATGDPIDPELAAVAATWPEGTGWFHGNGRAHHVELGSPSHLRLIAEGAVPVPAPEAPAG